MRRHEYRFMNSRSTPGRLSATAQSALKAAVLFGAVGVGAVTFGVLHFVGVVSAGDGYGVLWCLGGALCL